MSGRPPVSGATRLAAVIGDPVRHSLSPALHNAAFDALGLDWVYVALPVPAGRAAEALVGMRALGIEGLSVTMPHKDDVAAAVDALSPSAAALGTVNCVARDGGRLVGHSTDGDGFVDSLRRDAGVDPAGMRVVVLGAGGAARSVVVALAAAGVAEVRVVNRSAGAGERAAALAGDRGALGAPVDVAEADLVVNATPLGMGTDGRLPCDPALLHAGQVVADLVYHPLRTPLLEAAVAAGARAVDGLGMLVHQAARQLAIWTGAEPPVAAMRAAALAELARRA
jgi:shikimate dehydrogenase